MGNVVYSGIDWEAGYSAALTDIRNALNAMLSVTSDNALREALSHFITNLRVPGKEEVK